MCECPVYGGEVEISADPVEGELLECAECGAELEILALDPLTLGEAPDAEEDRGREDFDPGEHLAAFTRIAKDSREYQGHGWGCAWLEGGRWRLYHNVRPIWQDDWRPPGRTTLLLAHARSAFRDEGIRGRHRAACPRHDELSRRSGVLSDAHH